MKVDLGDLNAFVAVARARGFRDGARASGCAQEADAGHDIGNDPRRPIRAQQPHPEVGERRRPHRHQHRRPQPGAALPPLPLEPDGGAQHEGGGQHRKGLGEVARQEAPGRVAQRGRHWGLLLASVPGA